MSNPEDDTVLARLVRIETLLEMEFRSISRQLADHESRLRSSERWRYALPISAVAAVASAIGAIVAALGR